MDKINQLLAKIAVAIWLLIIAALFIFGLMQSVFYVFVLFIWSVITVSCLYRLTALFKTRNPLRVILKRDTDQLIFMPISGLFDFKHEPYFVTIASIKKIAIKDGLIRFYFGSDQVIEGNVVELKEVIGQYFDSFFTDQEQQKFDIVEIS